MKAFSPGSLLLAAFLLLGTAAAYKSELRLDWSTTGRFSLQPELQTILAEQQQPVRLLAVWPRQASALDEVERQLRLIADADPDLRFEQLDPELDRPQLAAFARQHGPALPGSIYVVSPERALRVAVSPMTLRTLQRDIGSSLVSLAQDQTTPLLIL
ncbi:MAG: hypothetical protein ACOCXJ_06460, partial [Planctomycetota bacterium]